MFGKKKGEGLSVVHYCGLPGFQQDGAAFMDIKEDAVLFTNTAGASVTLPLSKIECVDVLPEANYMLKYHNSPAVTAKVGAKWYGVISYNSDGTSKQIAFWYIAPKVSKVLYDLQNRCTRSGGVIL